MEVTFASRASSRRALAPSMTNSQVRHSRGFGTPDLQDQEDRGQTDAAADKGHDLPVSAGGDGAEPDVLAYGGEVGFL